MSSFLDPDISVLVVYKEDEKVVSVPGRITWCEDHPAIHGSYQFGVLFDYSYSDENSRLLLAVKDYIVTSSDDPSVTEELEFD